MTKLFITLALSLCLLGFKANAQIGELTLGIRTGSYSGFSFRSIYENDRALEAILGTRNKGTVITIRSLSYNPLNTDWGDNFKWYYGLGIHAGFTEDQYDFDFLEFELEKSSSRAFVSGLNAAVGLEYTFLQYPFSVGLEITPYAEMRQLRKFRAGNPGMSFTVRYYFRSKYYKNL